MACEPAWSINSGGNGREISTAKPASAHWEAAMKDRPMTPSELEGDVAPLGEREAQLQRPNDDGDLDERERPADGVDDHAAAQVGGEELGVEEGEIDEEEGFDGEEDPAVSRLVAAGDEEEGER